MPQLFTHCLPTIICVMFMSIVYIAYYVFFYFHGQFCIFICLFFLYNVQLIF